MPLVTAVIKLNDGGSVVPLRRTYVEHIVKVWGVAVPLPGQFITNDEGEVVDEHGNAGIRVPQSSGAKIHIRVLCHNAVVRVGHLGPLDHFADFEISNGDTVTITAANTPSIHAHFRVANRCAEVYDEVLAAFQPFASRQFLLGEERSLRQTRWGDRIDVWFPTPVPVPMSFVQPSVTLGSQPVIHFKDDDDRLFGTNGRPPSLIAAEVSHAAHFSLLTNQQRHDLTHKYLHFIAEDVASGGRGTHSLRKETSPIVAFIEAFDHFVNRLDVYRRSTGPVKSEQALRTFIDVEMRSETFGSLRTPAAVSRGERRGSAGVVDVRTSTNSRDEPEVFVPHDALMSTDGRSAANIEGAVYAALFLDFGRRVGLTTVVETFLASRALTVGDYRTWIENNRSDLSDALADVFTTWTL